MALSDKKILEERENGNIIIPYKTEADKEMGDIILAECTSYALSDGKIVETGVHPDIPIGIGYAIECLAIPEVEFFFG